MDLYIGQRLRIYQPHLCSHYWCTVIEVKEYFGVNALPSYLVVKKDDGSMAELSYLTRGLSWEIEE